jgi:hypothetical protein
MIIPRVSRFCAQLVFCILVCSFTCLAQFPLSFGIKGGVPLTDGLQNVTESIPGGIVNTYSASKDYVVGPMVQLRLPFHLAVEADALYRPINVTGSPTVPGGAASYKGDDGSWEFPIVAQYRFGWPLMKPYVEAGPSFRATSAIPLSRLSSAGVALGVGVDFHLLIVHIAPEIRYTRWAGDSAPTAATEYVRSRQNQVEFLVGLLF